MFVNFNLFIKKNKEFESKTRPKYKTIVKLEQNSDNFSDIDENLLEIEFIDESKYTEKTYCKVCSFEFGTVKDKKRHWFLLF